MRKRVVAIAGAVLVGVASLAIGAKPIYAPKNTSAPVVSGTTVVGSDLFCSQGSWTRNPTSYTYLWQNSPDGSTWSAIGGATSTPYTLQAADETKTVRCRVHALKGTTTGEAFSAAVGPITPVPGEGGGGTANIWVDSNGGTCSDSGSLVAYVDAAACGTLDAANDTCENGDTVRAMSLSGSQTISGSNSRSSACLVKPSSDATPVSLNGALTLQSTSAYLTFTGLHQTIDTDDYLNILDVSGDNLTFNNHTATKFEITAGANTVVVDDSDFGPCIASYGTGGAGVTQNNFGVCNNRILDSATNITVSDTDLHGNLQTWDGVSGPNGQPPHSECLAIFGGINLDILRNKLWDCGDSANTLVQANPGTGQRATDVSFIGNWFNVAWNATDGTATNEKCQGVDVRNADIAGAWVFSFNTLNPCTSGTTGLGIPWIGTSIAANLTSSTIVGNIGASLGANEVGGACPSGMTAAYNVQRPWGVGYTICGTNATEISSFAFLTDTTKHGSFDFHLTGAVQGWENTVPTGVAGGCPTDIDGTSRPVGANCDPGSDER
jgi:hypothetical protein